VFRPRTVRARLTLWYTLVLAAPLIAFALVSYFIFSRTLHNRTDAFIRDALQVFARELLVEYRRFPAVATAAATTVQEVRFQDLDIVVLDDVGAVIALPTNPDEQSRPGHALPRDSATILSAIRAQSSAPARMTTISQNGTDFRLLSQPLLLDQRPYRLAGVYPLAEVQATLQRIRKLFLIAIPLLIASAATGGYFLAKRSLAPVTSMAARAAEIGAATLHERLPVAAADDLGALARVLNDLLDRLEASFAQQRRFMADASHELRTPAAIVRSEADVTLSRDHRTESEYRESMVVVQDAARRLTRIVDDIFLLARADAGHLVMQTTPVALDDVVHDTARAVRPIADRRSVRIELGELVDAPFIGDSDLLGRVLLNLLDNAIKHAPENGTVQVAMRLREPWFEISVIDDGMGIPAEFQPRVFDRFFRVDPARSRAENTATSGAGLGLAIARRISEMHGGQLDLVGSQPGRTEFRIRLPVHAAAALA
jgi:heavy metal sensor kinase